MNRDQFISVIRGSVTSKQSRLYVFFGVFKNWLSRGCN